MKAILSLLAAGVLVLGAEEPTPFKDPEWLRQYEHAWTLLRDRYPEYLNPAYPDKIWTILRQHDAWARANRPDVWRNPYKILTYCQWQKAAEAQQAAVEQRARELAAAQAARSDWRTQAPVWKMFVGNKDFAEVNKEAIEAEKERVGMAQGGSYAQGVAGYSFPAQTAQAGHAASPPTAKHPASAIFKRVGNRIIVNNDRAGGYTVRGVRLYEFPSGTPTHRRSGDSWIPFNPEHPVIRDPE